MKIKKLCLTLILAGCFLGSRTYAMDKIENGECGHHIRRPEIAHKEGKIDERLKELGITLPPPPKPMANYVPFIKDGSTVRISGQLSFVGEKGWYGPVTSVKEGQKAAKHCLLNIIAHLKVAADGDLDRVQQCLNLTVVVNARRGFREHSKVANAASDLLVSIFGEKEMHTCDVFGASSLPMNASVVMRATFKLEEDHSHLDKLADKVYAKIIENLEHEGEAKLAEKLKHKSKAKL